MQVKTRILTHTASAEARRDPPWLIDVGLPALWPANRNGYFAVGNNAKWIERNQGQVLDILEYEHRKLFEQLQDLATEPDVLTRCGPAVSEDRIYDLGWDPGRAEDLLEELFANGTVEWHLFRTDDPSVVEAWHEARAINTWPSPLAECVLLAGDGCAGRLLYQALYWTPKRRIRFRDRLWIAKSREEWMAETGLTRHQYDRALAMLKDRELVQVTYRRFGGRRISHLRPNFFFSLVHPADLVQLARQSLELQESAVADAARRLNSRQSGY